MTVDQLAQRPTRAVAQPGEQRGPALAGIRVVDFSHLAAGPWATVLLADLGADVIKVEPPGKGEIARQIGSVFQGGESSTMLALNRNKRSMAINLFFY